MNQKSQTGRYGQVKEPGVFSRVTSVMRGQSAPRVTLVVLLLTFILGWLDEATGWEVSLLILYAMPIVLAVWWGGRGWALSSRCAPESSGGWSTRNGCRMRRA